MVHVKQVKENKKTINPTINIIFFSLDDCTAAAPE